MHAVAVLALDGAIAFEVGVAAAIFSHVRASDGGLAYTVEVCSERPRVRAEGFDIVAPDRLDRVAAADTVMVAGVIDPDRAVARRCWRRSARPGGAARG